MCTAAPARKALCQAQRKNNCSQAQPTKTRWPNKKSLRNHAATNATCTHIPRPACCKVRKAIQTRHMQATSEFENLIMAVRVSADIQQKGPCTFCCNSVCAGQQSCSHQHRSMQTSPTAAVNTEQLRQRQGLLCLRGGVEDADSTTHACLWQQQLGCCTW